MTMKAVKERESLPSATFGRETEYTGNVYTPRDILGPGGKLPLEVQKEGVQLLHDQSSLPQEDNQATSVSVAAGAGIGFAVGGVLTLALVGYCQRHASASGAARGRMALAPAQRAGPAGTAGREPATSKSATMAPLESA